MAKICHWGALASAYGSALAFVIQMIAHFGFDADHLAGLMAWPFVVLAISALAFLFFEAILTILGLRTHS
jgi:hypothetical protein